MVGQVKPVKISKPATLILLCESGSTELAGYVLCKDENEEERDYVEYVAQ